jgi:hypothetical protein
MQRDQLFHAVYEALSPGHCAICSLSLKGVQRFLDGFMYERVNDPWSREELIRARGFCAGHAWWLTRIQNSPSGVAILYRHLLEEFRNAFARSVAQRPAAASASGLMALLGNSRSDMAREIGEWLVPRRSCPACEDQREAESRYLWATAHALSDADFCERYEHSLGLCLRHLTALMDGVDAPAELEWLVRVEDVILQGLLRDLAEFWRKHDYRFRHEPMSDAEAAAWKRVLHKYVGAPGLVWRPTPAGA